MSGPVDVLAVMDALYDWACEASEEAIDGAGTRAEYAADLKAWHDARIAMAELIEAAVRALPFLRDEAAKYEDDGGNEPLETLRDLEDAIANIGGAS